jgi:hypothetical protein
LTGVYFLDGPAPRPTLDECVWSWNQNNQGWQWRRGADPSDDEYFAGITRPMRRADVSEIAESLLNDPRVQLALGALTSPAGSAIEQAVLTLYMPSTDARLLTDALNSALRTAKNEQKPLWLRTEVLIAVGIIVVGLLIAVSSRQRPAKA